MPDKAARDALIRDKISSSSWRVASAATRRCSSTPPQGLLFTRKTGVGP
ncbi:hypothetical protein MJ585_10675 [Klebsiella pneumoniae]|nr:hypothetical protein MJ585_10675 [Klebsiella pneumoniae]